MTYWRGHWQILLLGLAGAQASPRLARFRCRRLGVAAQQGDFLRRQGPWLPRSRGLRLW